MIRMAVLASTRPEQGVPGRDWPVMENVNVEVIAGVNLPMLIKLASVRESQSLAEAVASAQKAGRKYINIASQLLTNDKS